MTTENTIPSFVHLHLNTNYSFNHSLVESREAASICQEAGMGACACTDHGSLGVSMKFKFAMESQDIKPIYGCEFQVAQSNESLATSANVPNQHRGMTLVCLAENLEGYRNLCRLASEISLGDLRFEMKEQCISKELLRKHHKGLIALSGGPTGEVARKCSAGEQAVDDVIAEYLDIFGKGNFFLEMQDHGLAEEHAINQALLAASRRTGVPVVATNDVHYLTREQAHAHEVLLCIGRHTEMANSCHPVLPGGPEYYMKSPEEMAQLFHWCPEALQNTVAIAERCNVAIPTTGTDSTLSHKPLFLLPADFKGTQDEYLLKVCKAGLKRRYGIDADAPSHTIEEQQILDRLEQEMKIITSVSLSNELLVIWDLMWDSANERWRWYNVGCGTICGLLVAYLMPITDVDPLKYNLLFEHCLNEERKPYHLFFGIDRAMSNDVFPRTAMQRYGWDNVARLVELEPMEMQALISLVASTLGYKRYKQISDIAGEHWRMKYALSCSRKLQRLVKQKQWAREIVETVIALEGAVLRESSTYSGIAISDKNILDVCPIDASKDCLLERYEGEELGLLTMGWHRLDRFVEGALGDFVEKKGAEALNHPLPENAPKAFELLCKDDDRFYNDVLPEDMAEAEKVTAFMRKHCANEYGELGHLLAKVQPRNMAELIAFYAMRFWPMEFLDEYIRRRSGEEPVTYETPELEPILKETYGLIIYHEQFMQVVHVISGLSLGKADCIRRSLGKRKVQQTEMWHGIFFEEARKRGFSDDCIARIWDKLQYYSMYCFPKAHATARALLLYRVACIKANIL